MPIPKKIINFLEKHKIKHEILEHKTVYTAFDAAQTMGKKLSDIAKTLAIKADKKYILVVLPANRKINFDKLKKLLGAKKISIVKEVDIKKIFKVKPGTLLPFGTFYKTPVFVDKSLLKSRLVIVSAGSYTESLRLKVKDLLKQGAEVLSVFSKEHKFKKPKTTLSKKKKKRTAKNKSSKSGKKAKSKAKSKKTRKKPLNKKNKSIKKKTKSVKKTVK